MELIKIREENGQKLVSARELYLGLGLNKGHWKRWYESNVENNEYFLEDEQWTGFTIMANGNETKDFAISLEFAKHIAMMARAEKSHEYRNYFIECEKQLQTMKVDSYMIENPIERAKRWIEEQQEKEEALLIIEEQKPKVEAYEMYMDSDGLYTVTNASKMLGLKVKKEVYPYLRKKRLICKEGTKPTQYGIERKLFKLVVSGKFECTKITPLGIEYLRNRIEEIKG